MHPMRPTITGCVLLIGAIRATHRNAFDSESYTEEIPKTGLIKGDTDYLSLPAGHVNPEVTCPWSMNSNNAYYMIVSTWIYLGSVECPYISYTQLVSW